LNTIGSIEQVHQQKPLNLFSDGRLREEIGEIEELYSYVKGLVKKRLDQNPGEPVESVNVTPKPYL